MGRRPIPIEKQESATQRKNTYRTRYKGICKKVRELSIMSDVSILVVAKTTDTGRYNACFEGNRSSRDLILQYLNESNEIKEKSMHSTGEKNYEKQLEKLQRQVAEIEDRLRPLQNINQLEKIESLEELYEIENSIRNLNITSEDKKMAWEPPLPIYEPIVRDPSHHRWQMSRLGGSRGLRLGGRSLGPSVAPLYRDWKAAEYQAPKYQAAEYQAPEYQAAEYQAPEYQAAEYQAAEFQAAEYQAAEYRAAQWPPPRAHDDEAGPSHQQEFGTQTPWPDITHSTRQ